MVDGVRGPRLCVLGYHDPWNSDGADIPQGSHGIIDAAHMPGRISQTGLSWPVVEIHSSAGGVAHGTAAHDLQGA